MDHLANLDHLDLMVLQVTEEHLASQGPQGQ
jgi:hypothetical protein